MFETNQFLHDVVMTLKEAERLVAGWRLARHEPSRGPTKPTDTVMVGDRGDTRFIIRRDPKTGEEIEGWAYQRPGSAVISARR